MATTFTSVNPGDVISSDLMNFVLSKIQEYETRLEKLEAGGGSGQLTITSTNPPYQQNAGRTLSIVGKNFAVPPSSNTVTLGTYVVPAANFQSPNSDTVLTFLIPQNFIPPANGLVTIGITNILTQGSTSVLYKVLPYVPVAGPVPAVSAMQFLAPDTQLFVAHPVRITGSNFAPTVTDNQITFQVLNSSGAVVTYPTAANPLVFNTGGTSDTNNIYLTLPDMAEVQNTPGLPPNPVTVTMVITVGAASSAPFAFSVFRHT